LNSIEKIEKTNLPKTVEFNSYIQFQNVSFRYKNQDNYALKGINFNLKKGQTLGIIGISGAGKSTLVDIFIGLLNTEQGKILVDGKELDNHKRKLWTQNIGYVPQAPYLIDGTISDNIAFGITKENIDHSLVLHSTQISSMDDFVLDLPQGLSTFIGERGARLSGGQRQRIAMARALYKTPDIIIFDEATSALDTKNESEIKKTINSFKNKKTMIIIAHSLESVDECDWIIWLDKGRIVKQGKAFEVISEYKTFLENMKFNEN
jgi:ABC-type bacteriocin/lantibiotic exporter with double-glycine peptidase domain